VSRIKRLTQSYSKYIAVPWRDDAAAAQRVIFCVYNETEELRLRAKVDEFEIATRAANHEWALFDLTDSFPEWLASQRYAKSYFQKPNLLSTLLPKYLSYIETEFAAFLQQSVRRRLRRGAQGRRITVRLPEGQGSRGQAGPHGEGPSAGVLSLAATKTTTTACWTATTAGTTWPYRSPQTKNSD
jgi:hypothetical protein